MLTEYTVKIILFLVVVCCAAPYLLREIFWVLYPPVRISCERAIVGRITDVDMNRYYYLHHLDGNTRRYYDFNEFVPATSTVNRDSLTQYEENTLVLGAHLRVGDYVTKAARSIHLVVRRGSDET